MWVTPTLRSNGCSLSRQFEFYDARRDDRPYSPKAGKANFLPMQAGKIVASRIQEAKNSPRDSFSPRNKSVLRRNDQLDEH